MRYLIAVTVILVAFLFVTTPNVTGLVKITSIGLGGVALLYLLVQPFREV